MQSDEPVISRSLPGTLKCHATGVMCHAMQETTP